MLIKRFRLALFHIVEALTVIVKCVYTDQTKWSQYRKTLDVRQAQLDETEDDDHKIKTAPFVLEVLVQTERDDLESGFNREDAGEHLDTGNAAY